MTERRISIVSLFIAAMTLGAVPARAQAPARIRLGTLAPQGSSHHHILTAMGERWRAATGGQVQLTVYAGTMGSEADIVRRMRLGQLQAGTITEAGLRDIDPGVAALQELPMMYRSLDEFDWVLNRMRPVLERRMADKGFVVLFWGDAGWVHYFTRQSATLPDQFKRFKIFVTAGQTDQFDLMRSAGFQPVALEWADALTALRTGMVDAIPTIPYFALASQFYTIASYMVDIDWAPLMGATIISKRTWDALTPAQRDTLGQVAQQSGLEFQARGRAESDEAVAAMRQRGLDVVQLTPAATAAWRRTAEQLYPRIRGTMVPADMFDEVVRLVAEYRASHPAER